MRNESMLVKNEGIAMALLDRRRRPEIMDQPNLDSAKHRTALNGLRRVNSLSFSSRIYWPTVRKLANQIGNRPLRVLDLACGGGDVTISLAKMARRKKINLRITGWDISPLAISFAATHAKAARVDNVCFTEANVLQDTLPIDFDIVICSLFLHHLSEEQGSVLLQRMAAAARSVVLVNDLQRSRAGYYLARIGCRLLSRSPIVHFDGPVSVAGAYTIPEATQLAESAGLEGATVTSCWPERFLLSWSRA